MSYEKDRSTAKETRERIGIGQAGRQERERERMRSLPVGSTAVYLTMLRLLCDDLAGECALNASSSGVVAGALARGEDKE